MSIEIPAQPPEGINTLQFERLRSLLNELDFTPDLCKEAVFDKEAYPALLTYYGFDRVEVSVLDAGEVQVKLVYPDTANEQRVDTYQYLPSKHLVVYGIEASTEQLLALQTEREKLQEQLRKNNETVQDNFEAMIDMVQEMDDHAAVLDDYDMLADLIKGWRKNVFDTEKENVDWQYSLDAREAENKFGISQLLEGLSATNDDLDELWQPYCAACLGMALNSAQMDVLNDQIAQISDVKTTEFVAATPDDFIDLLEMLQSLIEDSFDS
jgi:hypothetical protein